MTKNRKDHTTRTLATMLRVLDDPGARPEDIRAAANWGLVPAGSAVAWLRGYAAGRRAGPPRAAPGLVKLRDEA